MKVHGLVYGSQDTMILNFFSSILKRFFPLIVQYMGVLRAFCAMLIFLHGQLYMIAKLL